MKPERTKTKGIGGHTSPGRGATDSWVTPQELVAALGPFDLDPCQCVPQPWPCAKEAYTVADDGLSKPWKGRVWLNPPYSAAGAWLRKLADHGDGIALIFARTETRMFVSNVWRRADALLFLYGRLYFHRPDGSRAGSNSGGPSVLVAYGDRNVQALRNSGLPGAFCDSWFED